MAKLKTLVDFYVDNGKVKGLDFAAYAWYLENHYRHLSKVREQKENEVS